jgi:methylated-DNA-protein-cysteine methyltransferase-like protein
MSFLEKVIKNIKDIPRGTATSYGYIAALSGSPRAALQVGRILRAKSTPEDLPWWRVINKEGYISIVNIEFPPVMQADLLKDEGIKVIKRNGMYWVDLQKYGWKPEM